MDVLTRSSEVHPRLENISMDSPPPAPPHYMFTNVEEIQYVQPYGPKIEVNLFIPKISTYFL